MKSNNNSAFSRFKAWLKKPNPLSIELFLYFIVLSFVMIVLLWLFQIVFLDDTYKTIKINEVKKTSSELMVAINSESFEDLVDNLSLENDMSALIVDFTNGTEIKGNLIGNNAPIAYLSLDDLMALYAKTQVEGSTTIYVSNSKQLKQQIYDQATSNSEGKIRSIVYATSTITSNQHEVMIIICSDIMPVTATTNTLKKQLSDISIILLVCSVLLSLYAAKHIAKPIEKINSSAKVMATGDYTVKFGGRGYKEIEELNDTLNYTVSQLAKADKMSKDLIANVSHDLRTPLTMISGYGEVMRDIPNENTPENVQVIIDEANRLTMLVNNLLDISKLQSGATGISLSQVNVSEMVAKIADTYTKMTAAEGYEISYQCPKEDIYVSADPLRLNQVFYNLMNNAINYTGKDKKVTLKATVNGNVVRFDIIDTGKGIAEKDIPLVWQRYYKVDKEHVRPETGSGLGLSIVKTILDLHKAQYGVISELGHGSDFWFELPLVNSD